MLIAEAIDLLLKPKQCIKIWCCNHPIGLWQQEASATKIINCYNISSVSNFSSSFSVIFCSDCFYLASISGKRSFFKSDILLSILSLLDQPATNAVRVLPQVVSIKEDTTNIFQFFEASSCSASSFFHFTASSASWFFQSFSNLLFVSNVIHFNHSRDWSPLPNWEFNWRCSICNIDNTSRLSLNILVGLSSCGKPAINVKL